MTFDDRATCHGCGRFGAYLFDGEHLCADCYEQHGSCCPEFGRETSDEQEIREALEELAQLCQRVRSGQPTK